jgi:hypothetical protein
MSFELTIRNYRCFQEPVTLSIDAHLTALIGINNSGKSSILRFFFEFRSIFERFLEALSNNDLDGLISYADVSRSHPFTPVNTVPDYQEMFCDFNSGNIEFTVSWIDQSVESQKPHQLSITFTVVRDSPRWYAELRIDKLPFSRAELGKIWLTEDVVAWGRKFHCCAQTD